MKYSDAVHTTHTGIRLDTKRIEQYLLPMKHFWLWNFAVFFGIHSHCVKNRFMLADYNFRSDRLFVNLKKFQQMMMGDNKIDKNEPTMNIWRERKVFSSIFE